MFTRRELIYSASVTLPASKRRELDSYLNQQIKKHRIPGLSVAVVKHGVQQISLGCGIANVEFGIPATPDSVYQIASVSKIFSATAIMLLVEQRKLSLESPVTTIFPEFPAKWRSIQVRNLLQHTSGLPRPNENPRQRRDKLVGPDQLDTFTASELAQFAAELPLQFEPGTKWAYTQTGFMIAGMIVEKLSGKSYTDYLNESVFQPLKMSTCRYGDSRIIVPGQPAGAYSRQAGNVLRNWIWPYSTTDYPAAGLNSSAVDLAKFFVALQQGKLLTTESLQLMWTATALAKYGLGWSVYQVHGNKAVGHEGGGCCWVTHFPDEQISAIVLSNLAGARADEMADDVAEMFL